MSPELCRFVSIQDGARRTWLTQRLWALAAGLPVKEVPIAKIAAFDQNCWFGASEPTCRNVAGHAKRIAAATFEYPIILAAEGWVMDGMHRVAKAFIEGRETILAVQFFETPEPDECVPPGSGPGIRPPTAGE